MFNGYFAKSTPDQQVEVANSADYTSPEAEKFHASQAWGR